VDAVQDTRKRAPESRRGDRPGRKRARLARPGDDVVDVKVDTLELTYLHAIWACATLSARVAGSAYADDYDGWTKYFLKRLARADRLKAMRLRRRLVLALGQLTVKHARDLAGGMRRLGQPDFDARVGELVGWKLIASTRNKRGRRPALSFHESLLLARQPKPSSDDAKASAIQRARDRVKRARGSVQRIGLGDVFDRLASTAKESE
jgi:hypothetical protein